MGETENLNNLIADVYTYAIHTNYVFSTLYPEERQKEIESTYNKKVKEEKYFAWKVLEYALKNSFNYKISDLTFTKTKNGKWVSDKVYFSISHSYGVVAVAVSTSPIGVDVELINPLKNATIKKVLLENEVALLTKVASNELDEFLASTWSKKESAFKRDGEGGFIPSKIDTTSQNFYKTTLDVNQKTYVLTLSTSLYNKVKINKITNL